MDYYNWEKVTQHVTAIHSLTGENMYLVEGDERAALIDTCLGVGNLKALVETLTKKPVIVLLTHGHLDHALGAPDFDKVYMNGKDREIYKEMCPIPERRGYMEAGLPPEIYAQIKEEDFTAPMPEKEFLPLEDGMVFDLGGIRVEAIAYPGHTQGSMVFLIREERILVLGDACNNSTFLFTEESSPVSEYRETTLKVAEKTKGRYDRVFLSHGDIDTGSEIMDNMAELCVDIMEGRTDDVPFEFMGMKAFVAKKYDDQFHRIDGKCGNLIYKKL